MEKSTVCKEFVPDVDSFDTWINYFLLCCEMLAIKDEEQPIKLCKVSFAANATSVIDLLAASAKWEELVTLLKTECGPGNEQLSAVEELNNLQQGSLIF